MSPLSQAGAVSTAENAAFPVDQSFDMSPAGDAHSRRWRQLAAPALQTAAVCWLSVAIAGQLLFAFYVVALYGRAAVQGRFEDWNKVLMVGYIPGATVHNAVLASHLLFAVAVVASGALQLVPQLRRTWPAFHRWNGRFYMIAAMVASVGGITMVWTTGAAGDLPQHVAVTINGILVLGFASLAWGCAMARRFDAHRRWALRLFLAVSGVWFFRIALMLWIVANQGPAGFNPKTFAGPFLTFLSFAQFMVPLGVLQLYFIAQDRRRPRGQLAMAGGLAVLTLMTVGGIGAATALMWLPKLR